MRERRIIAVLGSQGSGKTTLAQAIYGRAMQRGEKVRILDPNGNLGGGGFPADVDEWLAERLAEPIGKRPGLVVADDADRYLAKTPAKDSPWRKLYLTNRHVGVDLLVTARRAQNLASELLSGVDYLYVFALSSADVNGRKRLQEIAPGLVVPTQPYRFVCFQPKTMTGNIRTGRTRPGGGFTLDPI